MKPNVISETYEVMRKAVSTDESSPEYATFSQLHSFLAEAFFPSTDPANALEQYQGLTTKERLEKLDALMKPVINTQKSKATQMNIRLKALTFGELYVQARHIASTLPANTISPSDLAPFMAAYERKKQRDIDRLIRWHYPKERA